ncbi:glycoside hydrolase family 88 protein [Daldinia loculata]|nr:glycoside hydrolase family 88 protein [Daldinia loculata]
MATSEVPIVEMDQDGVGSAHDGRPLNLYSENVTAKIWGVAQRAFLRPTPPTLFPEYTKPGGVGYVYRDLEFWTSGFFPGCLYLLLERQRKYAHEARHIGQSSTEYEIHELQLQFACKWWTASLYRNAKLKTTHDLGFMIAPWARAAWELENDVKGFDTVITAAESLMTRYSPVVGCIRSWDTCTTKRYSFQDPEKDFLVIVDNLMNLDMLFWAAAKLQDNSMYAAALSHAKISQHCHVRADYSTAHVVVFDPGNGAIKSVLTNQGYADDSCWSRGQACAAMIASYGMLLIHEIETAAGRSSAYLQHALRITEAVCASHVNHPAKFVMEEEFVETPELGSLGDQKTMAVDMGKGAETILNGATINNYEFAPRRWANHGLVYADYFFLLVGNKLLEMGLGEKLVIAEGFGVTQGR